MDSSENPSKAAGSGAREWLKKEQFPDVTIKVFAREGDGSATIDDYRLSEILTMHADHCTAPLREKLETVTKQRDEYDNLNGWKQRADAVERELKELREALRQISVLETNIGDLAGSCAKRIARAALRGKGE